MQALRSEDLFKPPGVAETLDWATALRELDASTLTPQVVGDTLGALLKYQDDIARMQEARSLRRRLVDGSVRAQHRSGACRWRENDPRHLADNIIAFARALRAAGTSGRAAAR